MADENRFSGLSEAVEEDETEKADAPQNEEADPTAFAFEDTVQKSIYVRPEAYEQLEDAEALVNARLRTEHELKNMARREFFDAALRVAADHEDELVDRIVDERD
jgi:hypothetical protein